MNSNIYTVSRLNNKIKGMFDRDPDLTFLKVKGEISNYRLYPSGHHYFSLKDAGSVLKCVMFKGSATTLRFAPENGMSVIAAGSVSVYEKDGQYQLYVKGMERDGVGDLQAAYELLKEKLEKEGLFDERHKKPLPRYPRKIAVITSSAGAAVQDIIRILGTRWPMTEVEVMPVRVQGDEAPPEIAAAIAQANKKADADVIITGRGGGSIEDLWAFNDERVARAIFASHIPVISAVGHEPDVTIADYVADVRASTPSNAAEIAVPDALEVIAGLNLISDKMCRIISARIDALRQRVDEIKSKRVLQSPDIYLNDKRVDTDRNTERLLSAMRNIISVSKDKLNNERLYTVAQRRISRSREQFAALTAALDAMSPLKVLGRGYALALRKDGTTVKKADDVKRGDHIRVRLQKDEINCEVL